MQPHTIGTGRRRRLLFRDLERASDALSNITPNWFASVMGTGIVAGAAATLPVQPPGLRGAASCVWVLAALMLVLLTAANVAHLLRHPRQARANLTNPVMANFTGAIAMAFMTVGNGALLFGPDLLGEQAALGIDLVLWTIGTVIGLITAISVPVLLFLHEGNAEDAAFAGWLMPVVPPMVSSATGAALVPYLPAGELRTDLLAACAAFFGATIVPALLIMGQLWARLVRHGIGPATMVPTLWIVLGPLGQSATAAIAMSRAAGHVLSPGMAEAARFVGVAYAGPIIGTALLWMAIATVLTVRQLRRGMPFALTWWSFTFPVGTCVTGASSLAAEAGTGALRTLAVILYLGLVAAWAVVFARTAHGALRSGKLLAPPAP